MTRNSSADSFIAYSWQACQLLCHTMYPILLGGDVDWHCPWWDLSTISTLETWERKTSVVMKNEYFSASPSSILDVSHSLCHVFGRWVRSSPHILVQKLHFLFFYSVMYSSNRVASADPELCVISGLLTLLSNLVLLVFFPILQSSSLHKTEISIPIWLRIQR